MNSSRVVITILTFVLSGCGGRPSAGGGVQDAALAADVETFATRLAAGDEFSGVVSLARRGRALVRQGYGLADRKTGRPNAPEVPLLASLLAVFGQAMFAQMFLGPERGPFQTADQLTAVVGSDSAAGTILSAAIRDFVRTFPTKIATVMAAQIPEKWLPAIPGVQFVRLANDAASAHFQQCGAFLFEGRSGELQATS